MPLPSEIIAVLQTFQSVFTVPTWKKLQVLLAGTVLARGRRTVAAALRQTGHGNDSDYSRYHHVLNRASWSRMETARRLLRLVVSTFSRLDGQVELVIDETLERRWGRKIRLCGHYRDAAGVEPRALGIDERSALVGIGRGGAFAVDG